MQDQHFEICRKMVGKSSGLLYPQNRRKHFYYLRPMNTVKADTDQNNGKSREKPWHKDEYRNQNKASKKNDEYPSAIQDKHNCELVPEKYICYLLRYTSNLVRGWPHRKA